MKTVQAIANACGRSNEGVDNSNKSFRRMKKISVKCSDRMAAFSGRIIRESVDILKPSVPPCDFVAVAIGSLARGEATPYSDLEYFFLVAERSPDIVDYFKKLAITTYFQIGNLGQTKLAYMSIRELEGWFTDTAKNGFKIDGLTDKAGNIPTGNGSSEQHNHFIVTPCELAERYKHILDNPDREVAVRGDLTAMLTYMRPLYTHCNSDRDLLGELRDRIHSYDVNEERKKINIDMLNTDVKKFNFKPDDSLQEKGYKADVKREIYRFPSILLLDIAINTHSAGVNSWATLKILDSRYISTQLKSSLEFLLAAATYVRLAAYLYHDSQDDRMSVVQEMVQSHQTTSPQIPKSQCRWFAPSGLFTAMSVTLIMLKQRLIAHSSNVREELNKFTLGDETRARITTLYYTGRYMEALSALKQIYGDNLCHDPISVTQNMPTSQTEKQIISEVLYMCDETMAALVLYEHINDNNITDERNRIADCYVKLGDFDEAVTVLESITDKSAHVCYSLGHTYCYLEQHEKAEQFIFQALKLSYSEISSEKQYDYYGDPIENNKAAETQKTSFAAITSPEDRLSRIISSSPSVVACVGSLGYVYNRQGQYKLAESYYKKSLHLISELYGEGAAVPHAATVLGNLGLNYSIMGKYRYAKRYYKQSLAMYKHLAQGAESRDMAGTLNDLGNSYLAAGDEIKAVRTFKKALDMYIRVDPGNLRIISIRSYLSSVTSTSSQTSTDDETSGSSAPRSSVTSYTTNPPNSIRRYLCISEIYRRLCKPKYYIVVIPVMIVLAAIVGRKNWSKSSTHI